MASPLSLVDSLRSFSSPLLECSICYEPYRDPRILSCHHSFCMTCLINQMQTAGTSDHVICAICREVTDVPDGGLVNLASDFRVEQLRDLQKRLSGITESPQKADTDANEATKTCRLCKLKGFEVLAHGYCIQCKLNLCDVCQSQHSERAEFQRHIIVSADAARQMLVCEEHKEEDISFFCLVCKQMICNICMMTSCGQHGTLSLEERLKGVQLFVNSKYDHLRDTLDKYNVQAGSHMSAFEGSRERLKNHAQRTLDEVRGQYVLLKQRLDIEEKKMVGRFETSRQRLEESLVELKGLKHSLEMGDWICVGKKFLDMESMPDEVPELYLPQNSVTYEEDTSGISVGRLSSVPVRAGDPNHKMSLTQGVMIVDARAPSVHELRSQIDNYIQQLNAYAYDNDLWPSPSCSTCDDLPETSYHFFLECPQFASPRRQLLSSLTEMMEPMYVAHLDDAAMVTLFTNGDDSLPRDTNRKLLLTVLLYLNETNRFSENEPFLSSEIDRSIQSLNLNAR